MLARKSPSCAAVLAAVALLAWVRPARSQTFDLQNDRVEMTELKGLWHFHTGDDPRWADPSFDDSSWALLPSDDTWDTQKAYEHYDGMAWYRFRVTHAPPHGQLAVLVPKLLTSYQIYVNGHMIGQAGRMPPHPAAPLPLIAVFSIPDNLSSSGEPLCFAIRVWSWPYLPMLGRGPGEPLRIGDAAVLNEWKSTQREERYWRLSSGNFLLFLGILAALASFGLYALRPAEREYLWFGISELFSAGFPAVLDWAAFRPLSMSSYVLLASLFQAVQGIAFLLFVVELLRERRGWLFWTATGFFAVFIFLDIAGPYWEWIGLTTWLITGQLVNLFYLATVLVLLVRGAMRGNFDAHLLLYPVGVRIGFNLLVYLFKSDRVTNPIHWPFPISLGDLADLLQLLGIFAILLLRFARSRRGEQRMAGELEAARAVQHVLVPQEVEPIPGFHIECVYKPASEVGGDFFQVIPLDEGGALVAIGDVSGKGMPAAMTVSLLVGTLRTLAHYLQSPGEILAKMNQRMIGRGDGGFTTCLILRIEATGLATLANAGHLAPYLNGEEMAVSSGLPLGLDASSAYPEISVQLPATAHLTLMTDGVAEARNKSGELLGFDRTAAIAAGSAESIALAAEQFGQQDDITVLTVEMEPVAESAPLRVALPGLAPA